jgi:hypothetical protein
VHGEAESSEDGQYQYERDQSDHVFLLDLDCLRVIAPARLENYPL